MISPNYQIVAFWPPPLVKIVKLDEKYKTTSFFGVKLLKCSFRKKKKNQLKKCPKKDIVLKKKKKKKERKKKKKNGGARLRPTSPATPYAGFARD
jgi:ssDNA-binding Zn-finger/Zn-ribbon topoisomerase 1